MKATQLAVVCLLCLLVSSCASYFEEVKTAREAAEVKRFPASPEEVLAAARMAMEEIGEDNGLIIWRENEVSFLATVRLHPLSNNYVYYDFKALAKDDETEARLELAADIGSFLIEMRVEVSKLNYYTEFWSSLEGHLGQKARTVPHDQASDAAGQ